MGSAGYQTGAHVVFKLSVHIVFVTKYRRKAITARVWEVMLAAFREVCVIADCDLTESGYEPDHAHLLVAFPPKVCLATLAHPPKPGHVWLYIPIPHHRMLVEEPFEHSVATPTTTAPGGEA